MPSAVTDLVRLGSFDQRGGGDECQEAVDEVVDADEVVNVEAEVNAKRAWMRWSTRRLERWIAKRMLRGQCVLSVHLCNGAIMAVIFVLFEWLARML